MTVMPLPGARPFRARFELAVAFGEGNEPWVIKFE